MIPESRDIYTSREIAGFYFKKPIQEVSLVDIREALRNVPHVAVNGGSLFRWPGSSGSPERAFAVRNHDSYDTLAKVRRHIIDTGASGRIARSVLIYSMDKVSKTVPKRSLRSVVEDLQRRVEDLESRL